MRESGFSLSVDLPDLDHEEATRRVVEKLDDEGFGILTEINVKDTLKKKLNVEYPRYVILGACNPPLAHRALAAELDIGVLLPCNVVVAERPGGGSIVSAMDPVAAFELIDNPTVEPIAREVRQKLERVLEQLP
ncbi:MAG: DUF302 domain-containing protein [Thermoanaerobaculales bacterium]|nr:DUF302 domain-containing protein [Thermoanaerobaculales bacterium]